MRMRERSRRRARQTGTMLEEQYASVGFGPIRVGAFDFHENQSDFSSFRQATKPIGYAWQGVQAFQMELNIDPLTAISGGNPYYHRQRTIEFGQLSSSHGQFIDPGVAIIQNSDLSPAYDTSFAAKAAAVIRRRFAGG